MENFTLSHFSGSFKSNGKAKTFVQGKKKLDAIALPEFSKHGLMGLSRELCPNVFPFAQILTLNHIEDWELEDPPFPEGSSSHSNEDNLAIACKCRKNKGLIFILSSWEVLKDDKKTQRSYSQLSCGSVTTGKSHESSVTEHTPPFPPGPPKCSLHLCSILSSLLGKSWWLLPQQY